MRYLILECDNCETKYHLEYNDEQHGGGYEPTVCPFCGEELDDDFLNYTSPDDLNDDSDDDDLDYREEE